MMKLLLIVALSACGFTYRDGIAGGAFATTMVLDAIETRIVEHSCNEGNPILGRCGEGVSMWLYFPLITAAAVGAVAATPKGDWRMLLEGVLVGVEVKTVVRNYQVGL
jgi:phosphoribosylformylglycinamidine (FGAM) synthase-like amidotransferase family enzyme